MATKTSGFTTPDSVNTRIGDLTFERGFPTEETKRKVFDEIDYQRAVQAYLWGYPAVSFESIRLAAIQHLGADFHDVLIADKFADPGGLWLTANNSTIYALTNVDLGKSGPVVVDVPPGLVVGLIDDFWQRCIADVGLPGPDGDKVGNSSSCLRTMPATSRVRLSHRQSPAAQLQRDGSRDPQRGHGHAPETVQTVKQLRVYPWSERANPKATKFISISGIEIDTLPPHGLEFWSRLSAFIDNNPVQERDLFDMGMLKPLGIEKGKPFEPDARQRAILEEAARIGDAMGRVMLFDGPERFPKPHPFPGTNWQWVFQVNPVQQTDTYGEVDERLHYTYGAIYTAPALGIMQAGPGGNYVQTFKDKTAAALRAARTTACTCPLTYPRRPSAR